MVALSFFSGLTELRLIDQVGGKQAYALVTPPIHTCYVLT